MRKHFIFTDMSDESYYPAGAYNDPDAPWNQKDYEEKEFNVTISQSLSKDTVVTTDDYYTEGVEYDPDESGYVEEIVTNDVEWKPIYGQSHYTPLELIGICKKLADFTAESHRYDTGKVGDYTLQELFHISEECDGWTEDDIEVFES